MESVEPADIAPEDDPVYRRTQMYKFLCKANTEVERSEELRKQLQIGSDLMPTERDQMETLLLTQSDVFVLSDEELGETDLVSHSIDTGNAMPVKTLPCRLPYTSRKELEEEMQKLMDNGCIDPSNSSYASLLVLVRKKNGGLRVCVDYRNVNKDTVLDRYPMPRIDELVDMVGPNQPTVISLLDLM